MKKIISFRFLVTQYCYLLPTTYHIVELRHGLY